MLQCVAVCCSGLQVDAVCYQVQIRVAIRVAIESFVQCVAVRCCVLQCVAVRVAVYFRVLQCVADYKSEMQ